MGRPTSWVSVHICDLPTLAGAALNSQRVCLAEPECAYSNYSKHTTELKNDSRDVNMTHIARKEMHTKSWHVACH